MDRGIIPSLGARGLHKFHGIQPSNQGIGRGTKIDKKQVTYIAKEKLNGKTIEVATRMVSLFDSITPKEMAEFQRQDNKLHPYSLMLNRIKNHQKKLHTKSDPSYPIN